MDGFTFPAHFSLKNPQSLGQAKEVAQATLKQTLPFKLQQHFGYVKGDYLPLFPLVHEESLSFLSSAAGQAATGLVTLEPNLNWAYGLKAIENYSDIEKLSLAEKTAQLIAYGSFGDFKELFLKLEPFAPPMKKAYGQLILKAFHQLKAGHHAQALDFTVGGSGSQDGAPLAEAFNQLTHAGYFSDREIEDAAFDIPTLLIAGYPGDSHTCLNVSEQSLVSVLNELSTKLPILTSKEKYLWERPLKTLAGKPLFGFCPQNPGPAVKDLASSLLPQL